MFKVVVGIVLFLITSLPAGAAHLEGVTMAEHYLLNGKELVLNGMGLREATIFKVDVYVAGLYVEAKSQNSAEIISSQGLKHVEMKFLRNVGADRMRSTWKESFERNCKNDCEPLRPALKQLLDIMADVKKGDLVSLSFLPGRVELDCNGKKLGVIEGGDRFSGLLLACWIGPYPPNEGLKEGMLGR